MRLTILGSGTSVGVPTIGCECEVCKSNDPHDKRFRASALVETDSTRILIDCGPDFRLQMLDREFRRIDAVFLTHIHYDHVGGLDDLRPFCKFGEVNIYAGKPTVNGLTRTMPYCLEGHRYPGAPKINLNVIMPHDTITVGDLSVVPVEVMHGKLPILGYRIGDLLYITDMKTIDDDEYSYFDGVKTLIVNALRFSPEHHAHQTVADAIAFAARVGAERTFLTHLNHDVGLHESVNKILPPTVRLAYDGMVLDV